VLNVLAHLNSFAVFIDSTLFLLARALLVSRSLLCSRRQKGEKIEQLLCKVVLPGEGLNNVPKAWRVRRGRLLSAAPADGLRPPIVSSLLGSAP
jgi:hypothetical protein